MIALQINPPRNVPIIIKIASASEYRESCRPSQPSRALVNEYKMLRSPVTVILLIARADTQDQMRTRSKPSRFISQVPRVSFINDGLNKMHQDCCKKNIIFKIHFLDVD